MSMKRTAYLCLLSLLAAAGPAYSGEGAAGGPVRALRPSAAESSRNYYEMPGCALLTTRKVLNDLTYIDQILSNEVSYLESDAGRLYQSLQSYSQSLNVDWGSYSKKGVRGRSGYEEIRGYLWETYEAVKRLAGTMRSASERGRRLEKEWWAIRKLSEKKADTRLNRLKKSLDKLAGKLNSINGKAPSLQSQLDSSRAYYLQYMNGLGPEVFDSEEVVDIPSPWHWTYRDSQTPRPDMEYAFAQTYEDYFDLSHKELHTGLKRE